MTTAALVVMVVEQEEANREREQWEGSFQEARGKRGEEGDGRGEKEAGEGA